MPWQGGDLSNINLWHLALVLESSICKVGKSLQTFEAIL